MTLAKCFASLSLISFVISSISSIYIYPHMEIGNMIDERIKVTVWFFNASAIGSKTFSFKAYLSITNALILYI